MSACSCHLTAALSLVLLVLCVVDVVDASTARRGKVTKHHRHEHYRDHVVDLLPDITDHAVMKELRCSSCQELSAQLYDTLLQLYRAKDPSHVELVDVIDNMCLHHVNMYGLLPDPQNPDKASTTVSRDSNLDLIQGIWVNQFMKDRCSHMMVHHEDAIINKHPEADSLAHFQHLMCVDWDKSCDDPAPTKGGSAVAVSPKISAAKPLSKGTFSRSLGTDEM